MVNSKSLAVFLVLAYGLCGPLQAERCPVGDLDGDCVVGFGDMRVLADNWLDSGCAAPDCGVDMDAVAGVNGGDFAILGENWGIRGSLTIVINEFMAKNDNTVQDPEDSGGGWDDWIEIHNYGSDAVDVGGMYLTDDLEDLTKWRVPTDDPSATTIAAGGYLIIWADGDTGEGTLHASFSLSAGGEDVALADTSGNLLDGVSYGVLEADQSYGRLPNGTGAWRLLPSATPGSPNTGEPVQVAINEIMYHPGHPDDGIEDVNKEYVELHNFGSQAVSVSGWRFVDGVDYTITGDVSIEAGDYLVVAADVNTFAAEYPGVSNIVGGWVGKLSNNGERITIVDAGGVTVDTIRYADQGDWARRELGPVDHYHRGWQWSDAHDGDGASLELIKAGFSNEHGQNWSSSDAAKGTPGTANTLVQSDIAPVIMEVEHFPLIPRSGETVTVTARIFDDSPGHVNAWLHYKEDGAGVFAAVTMADDGQSDDGAAGDGVYGGRVPARSDGTVMEFYVRAVDMLANMRTWPAPSNVDGAAQQVTNALYRVDDSFSRTWSSDNQPVYYVVMKESELTELEDIGDTDLDGRPWYASEGMSNAQMNATFISVCGYDTDLRYRLGVRNRGNRSRNNPPMSFRVNFAHDDGWNGATALNLNSKYTHLQFMGSVMFRLAGMAACEATPVQLRINGRNTALGNTGETYGSYVALEAFDSDWAENHFPDDADGNLYRATYVLDESSGRRTDALLDYLGSAQNPDMAQYRLNYPKQTNTSANDYSDLLDLIDRLNNPNITDEEFLANLEEACDVRQWMRFLAVDALVGNREGGLNEGEGDDFAIYNGQGEQRWWLVPHDLDTVLGQGDKSYSPDYDIWEYANTDGLERLMSQPDAVKMFYEEYWKLAHSVFDPADFDPLVDHLLGDWVSSGEINGNNGIKDYVVERRDDVVLGASPQIPQTFEAGCNLPVVGGYFQTASGTVNLSGRFNAVTTRSITVNGAAVSELDWSQKDGTWSFDAVALNPGVNRIYVKAFDGVAGSGAQVDAGHVDVWYDTGLMNEYPRDVQAGASLSADPTVVNANMVVRDSYLPGIAVLVRIELLNEAGEIARDVWDATATLSVDNSGVAMSTDQVRLYNGLGSALITFSGGGDFVLTANVEGLEVSRSLADLTGEPINVVSGGIAADETWSGVYRITGGDFDIPDGVTLTLSPGVLVLIDGVSSGTDGTDIDVDGAIQSLGTASSPVTITAYAAGENWGELHFSDADASMFTYTNVSGAGHSPRIAHSNSGPAFRISDSALVFESCSLTDHVGKLMHVTRVSDLTFHKCILSRCVMGPEIDGTALQFEDSWIVEMLADDDADGIYIHWQRPGQECTMRRGVLANIGDDGIDTASSDVLVEDFIIRDCKDKGISIYNGATTVSHCLVVANNRAPERTMVASIAAQTSEGATTTINIDRTTVVSAKTDGVADLGIQSYNKTGVSNGRIIWNVTNSIIDATDPVDVQAPYLDSDINISFTDVYSEVWPGQGNLVGDPLFVDAAAGDYRLQAGSPCIDAGDPGVDSDPDMTVADMGYYAIDQTTVNVDPGSLAGDTVWTASEGPYRITSELIVPVGTTLTIMPGTTVFFDPGAKLTVQGRLIAEGTEYQKIRFTRTAGTGGVWGGIQFVEADGDNRIRHAILEYGQTADGMIGLTESRLLLENSTLDHSTLRRIRTVISSLVVRGCVFTDTVPPGQAPTNNSTEHIWGTSIPSAGQMLIEGNVFGRTPGHNDAIDFDGHSRPRPIPYIINNVFMGGGDDALDLETDAHIEGNVFMHYHKDAYNPDPGESNVISAGSGYDYVMVRNVFYDVDHATLTKEDSFTTFVNNTVVDCSKAAIYFDLAGQTSGPGIGAYVDGCIFSNTPMVFDEITESTVLSVNNSLIDKQWHSLGTSNIESDPLFVDSAGDFKLRTVSPAVGAGPWGLDMGAYVEAGAAVSGEPDGATYRTDTVLQAGGPGITHYKYSLSGEEGTWSGERDVNVPIVLSDLTNGNTYSVHVLGKDSAGIWQETPAKSRSWTVDTAYSKLVINEILAHTHGTDPDLIELYYDGPGPIDLTGMSLTDDPENPRRFIFSGSTVTDPVMNPGEYMVLYGDTTQMRNHLGFGLLAEGEALYLYDKPGNGGSLVDSVEFGLQINDFSIGRIGYGGKWMLNDPTLGTANRRAGLGKPDGLKINEWLASTDVFFDDDFIELYNPDPRPVSLGGLYLTDDVSTQLTKHRIEPLSFIPGGGFTVLQAVDGNGAGEVSFGIDAHGEILALLDENLEEIDKVIFTPQTTDVSQGRSPDGAGVFEFFDLPTPRVANPASTSSNILLVAEDAQKRVLVPVTDIGDWRSDPAYDDSSWQLCSGGPGGVGYDRRNDYDSYITLDVESKMYETMNSCYIRIPFELSSDSGGFSDLTLRVRYDDGFVAYINGQRVASRNFASSTVAWNDNADDDHSDSAAVQFEDIDISQYAGALHTGQNVLAIHGLNGGTGSSDFLISCELVGTITASSDAYIARAFELIDGLRITEIMYHAPQGSEYDYIELQNISGTSLDISGVRLVEGVVFEFGAMVLGPGEYVVVASDTAAFASQYGGGARPAGSYTGNLSNGGEDIVLSLPWPLEAAIMRFDYVDTWYPTTDGGGAALTIIDPYGSAGNWGNATAWQAANPSPGGP